MQKINDYINWFGKDCRRYFTNYYNQIYPRNAFKGRDWYSTFFCINLIITINEKRIFHTNIVGFYYSDNDECQHHEIELEDRKIISWEIDLNRSKDSVTYSVIKETYNSVIIEVNACFHNININATILLTKNILQCFKIDDCKYVLNRFFNIFESKTMGIIPMEEIIRDTDFSNIVLDYKENKFIISVFYCCRKVVIEYTRDLETGNINIR